MARITHVKAAQQRYAMVPVIDPDTGEQKKTPVMATRTIRHESGETEKVRVQKTTKRGHPVFMKVTATDKTHPLPNHACEKCGKKIAVGAPYKHVTPKSGPYGGRTRRRCAECPTWQAWDLSNALWARIAQAVDEAQDGVSDAVNAHSSDDAESALSSAAESIRELAEEKADAAQNMEDGFGHETEQSMELRDQADQLEQWADEIESADIPDFPEEPEGDVPCADCDGEGTKEPEGDGEPTQCPKCEGQGEVAATEVTENQITDWESEVEDAASILDNSPL